MRNIVNWFFLIVNKIIKKSRFTAIRNSTIHPTSVVHSGTDIVNSEFGRYSYCGYDCLIVNTELGAFCSIASNVSIGGAAHPIHFVSTSPVFLSHKDSIKKKFSNFEYLPIRITRIDSDVWIGEGAFVKAGVHIGVGSIIGMGAVVTKDVEPYSIVAGNPAKIIRKRFPEDIIVGLLQLRWWELPDDEIMVISKFFDNPEVLLKSKGLL